MIVQFKKDNQEHQDLRTMLQILPKKLLRKVAIVTHLMSTYRDSKRLIMKFQELVLTAEEIQWSSTTPSNLVQISNQTWKRLQIQFLVEIILEPENMTLIITKLQQIKNFKVVLPITLYCLPGKITKSEIPELQNNLGQPKLRNVLQQILVQEVISTRKRKVLMSLKRHSLFQIFNLVQIEDLNTKNKLMVSLDQANITIKINGIREHTISNFLTSKLTHFKIIQAWVHQVVSTCAQDHFYSEENKQQAIMELKAALYHLTFKTIMEILIYTQIIDTLQQLKYYKLMHTNNKRRYNL